MKLVGKQITVDIKPIKPFVKQINIRGATAHFAQDM